MILRIEDLQAMAGKVLAAVDSNDLSLVTETLQLKTENNILYVSVTNGDYYVKVKLDVGDNINFHATVNANLFLKLLSQITTDTVEFTRHDTYLQIKGNGTYKLPLIFVDDKLLTLPEISIQNPTSSFSISGAILNSIAQYNSRELTKGIISKPVMKFYYIDDKGAITFTSGACVNSFNLSNPVKLLLNNRLVKLFRLFKDEEVSFTLGYDAISNDIIQTKVKFETTDVIITAIISCDDNMLNSVPVEAIRGRANATYPYSININKDGLIQTINRLLLFATGGSSKEICKPYSEFRFENDKVIIYDVNKENNEAIYYNNTILDMKETYIATLDLTDLKKTLDACPEQYLTINFGDGSAIVLARANIKNVIPEIVTM